MGFPRIALAIRGPLCFHIKFRIFCSIYVGEKNPWDCFESVDCFTKHGHFNNGNSSKHEHMIYFHFCMTSCFLTMPYPFQYTGLSHSRLNLFLSTLFFFNSWSGIVFLITLSASLLLLYRSATDFSMLILCLAT